MNQFNMSWRQVNKPRLPLLLKLRLRFGLLWKKSRPSACDFDGLANWLLAVVMVAMLLTTYGLLDAHDQATVARAESEQATSRLAHLLNGGVITDQAQTVAVRCLNVLDVVQ
jgi:hypothetical protein